MIEREGKRCAQKNHQDKVHGLDKDALIGGDVSLVYALEMLQLTDKRV
jgi:hypothetical protein